MYYKKSSYDAYLPYYQREGRDGNMAEFWNNYAWVWHHWAVTL